jgi:Tfp pilus assembly PilM family ATPase
MKSIRHTGVSFLNGQIQIAEIEHGKKPTLTGVAERPASIDFAGTNGLLSATHADLPALAKELAAALKEARSESDILSVALPTDHVFVNIITLDSSLQGTELAAHLQWEFEQFHPDLSAKEMIIGTESLPGGSQEASQAFLVSVRRGTVAFFRKVSQEVKRQLRFVDIDHFSTEKALRLNFPEFTKAYVLLLGLRPGLLDASLMIDGKMCDYRTYAATAPQEVTRAAATYLDTVKTQNGIENLTHLLVHGVDATYGILSMIQEVTGLHTQALDATRNLAVGKKVNEDLTSESSRFAAAIGLALRSPA